MPGSATGFANMVKKVDNMMKSNLGYTTWVKFKLNNLEIDTASPSNNYFMHLQNEKNGSGCANKFTLNISFVPGYGSNDVNFIDKALATSNRTCELMYGYYGSGSELVTAKYSGTMMDYSVEIRDGALYYTITGYSNIVRLIEDRGTYGSGYTKPKKPTTVLKEIFEQKLGPLGYKVEIEPGSNDDMEVEIQEMTDVTLFEYADTLMRMARCSSEDENTRPEEMSMYGYIINDSDPKTVTIKKFDPKSKAEPVFVFNWMDPTKSGGNIVIDFKTEFKGIMLMAYDYINQNEKNYSAINLRGDVVPFNIQSPVGFEENTIDKIVEKNVWARAMQLSYRANMTLLGIPYDIPIGTCIKVIPLIMGKAHLTQGKYMVLRTIDIIDPSGFITTLDLLKLPSNE